MQRTVAENIGPMTAMIRRHTKLPIAVGLGISTPDQARQVAAHADAVVVGSAVVHQIGERGRQPDLVPHVSALVRSLAEAVKQP